jgi:hypothetical protein
MIERAYDAGWLVVVLVMLAWWGALLISDDVQVPVVRRCSDRTLPPTLKDVLSRLPEHEAVAAKAGETCPITHAHEATHFVNSRASTAKERGFYLLDGIAWRVPIPKRTKLMHVAEAVPPKYRGKTYQTYLIDAQQWWQDIAIYPLDEAVAYENGCLTRNELGMATRQETERFAVELLVYSKYAVDEVCRREGDDYSKGELRDLLELLVARARMVIKDFDKQPYADALDGVGVALLAEMEAGRGSEEE